MQIQTLVMAWQVYSIKKDPLALGLIGLFEAAPALSIALAAGDIVDRTDPLRVYKNVLRGVFLSCLVLLAASWPGLRLSQDGRVWAIYGAAFLAGCARGFGSPSTYALVPQMVPRDALAASSAWITVAFQTASVVGPGVGGMLFAWHGPLLAYGADGGLLLAAMFAAASIRLKPKIGTAKTGEGAWTRATSGLKYVFRHELLLPALALDMFAVLFGGVEAILPIFASDILKIGPAGLGFLQASASVGALIGSAWMVRSHPRRGAGKVLLVVVTGFGLCMVGFALSRSVWLSMALLAMGGLLDSISMVIRGAIVQLFSPDDMRGRISAVNSIFIGVSNELGAFESGAAAKLLGTVPSVLAGGCVTLATVAVAAAFSPRLREMELA